jgi:cytochrome c oxidase accessory protein FixG
MLGFSGTREWVYPQSVQGRFTRIRRWTFLGLHLILFATPWIYVEGHPALRIDIPGRRVFLLGEIFTASDTIFLLLLLLFLAFSLFFFTAILGRIWCGYACPQTVFLETWIRPIELWIEGDRSQRKRRDTRGLSLDLAWRKAAKWSLFLSVSFLLGMAFVSLFSGARELWTGRAGPVAYSLVAATTLIWFWDFTWFREQFCNFLCPYARFQSALTDDETLLIAYDLRRGEPREPGRAAAADGRCIECGKCVAVCPQGIDIRDGFQLECIQCARCIDACAGVMERLGHPTLVRYTSVSQEEGRRARRFQPRTLVYAALLAALFIAGGALGAGRVPFEATVNRAPGSLFTVDADGFVRNTYLLKITNNAPGGPIQFHVSVVGLPDAEVISQAEGVEVGSTVTRTIPLIIRVQGDAGLARTTPIQVHIRSPGAEVIVSTTFKTGADIGSTSAAG